VEDVVAKDIHRGEDKGWTVQPLKVNKNSRLATIMGATEVATYSGHHQALKELGEGLQVTAWAEDGIIEAVELPEHPWFICVQWHPEVSAIDDATQQHIFDELVRSARKTKASGQYSE
jgi:putative glutamine amidotransferase